jgi:hypothetical protein
MLVPEAAVIFPSPDILFAKGAMGSATLEEAGARAGLVSVLLSCPAARADSTAMTVTAMTV